MNSLSYAVVLLAAAPILVFAASALLTGLVLDRLRRHAVLDRPGPRSAHAVPTPRGGGIAVLIALYPAWLLAAPLTGTDESLWVVSLWVLGAAVLIAAISWLDDLRNLSPALRLPVHVAAVAIALSGAAIAGAPPVFQGLLPDWLDLLVTGLLWLWFLNLFNFMDGIDAIAGAETVVIGVGVALVALLAWPLASALPQAWLGLTLAAAAGGFLLWNRPPAKIFLGDVGSIPLGFLAGWLLIETARGGAWAAALILPAVFVADATWTLVARLARGANPLEAHAEHVYQRAVRQVGRSHGQVVAFVSIANLVLIALAAGAEMENERIMALLGAAAVVLLLARRLLRPLPRETVKEPES
jgi:UDP-N-acetylmuramyl pentapeptide phosphotransferase/UDP-N-acetylglucosamine-1-phosphate transferase